MADENPNEGTSSTSAGGTGVPPVFFEKTFRRHLPHWQVAGAIYFLTWRCTESVLLTEAERDIVLSAIRYWDGLRWEVYAAVVMPDHVHSLARPLEKENSGRWDLGELLHSVKSFSAHEILKKRRVSSLEGPASRQPSSIWQDETYDRWMRDDDEVHEKVSYIIGNPVKSGLVEEPENYPWLYIRFSQDDRRDAGPTLQTSILQTSLSLACPPRHGRP